jgi:putative flavoprotein involved in K+ transport
LQGLDTWIHGMILHGLWTSPFLLRGELHSAPVALLKLLHWVFVVWVAHAAMNQYFRCSTATLMVQAWRILTDMGRSSSSSLKGRPPTTLSRMIAVSSAKPAPADEQGGVKNSDDDDTDSESDSSESAGEFMPLVKKPLAEDFVVRDLLQEGRVPSELSGRRGAASRGVDTAVRIEKTMMILSVVYIFGYGVAPFMLLSSDSVPDEKDGVQLTWSLLLYAWMLMSILCGVDSMLLERMENATTSIQEPSVNRWASIRSSIDLALIVIGVPSSASFQLKLVALVLAAVVTTKSFLRSESRRASVPIWYALLAAEFVTKVVLSKSIVNRSEDALPWIDASLSLVWACLSVTRSPVASIPTISIQRKTPDIAFLGHPMELFDCWAFWLLPYPVAERWTRPWWSIPLWPIHYIVSYYTCHWRARLFGDDFSIFNADDVNYGGVQMQTWISVHFARHFSLSPWHVKSNIEAAARYANQSGVKVLCLGALNKAEGINGGGDSVVRALGSNPSVSIIHGNHLTAAAVAETARQVFGERAKVFLTGASSKVGWAVAQALRDRFGYEILCHSTDQSRLDLFSRHGFQATSKLADGITFSDRWIVGKYDPRVADLMPQDGTALVFAVPHPLARRKDIRVIEGGTLHMDLSRLDRPRCFTNKLKEHEIFACHAAGIVAAHRIKCGLVGIDGIVHETGPVDPHTMDDWLKDANALGFSVPIVDPVVSSHDNCISKMPTVVVVGAGPAGLAVAASLRRRGIPCTVLEEQTDLDAFGSWGQHFSGLEVTSQKKWCHLPGFPMSKEDFPDEYVTASDYQRYLRLYTRRFGITVQRGFRVKHIERGGKNTAPWIVECDSSCKSIPALAVVVATGKHRIPQRDTSDQVCLKLHNAGIHTVHSTELKDDASWEKAINAARKGKLCIVGLGNSAADICTSILKSCGPAFGDTAVHLAVRTVPPVFPRRSGPFRVDTVGSMIRRVPTAVQEATIRLLWRSLPCSSACDEAFPAHLPRWSRFAGRVPVIDKQGLIKSGLESGVIVPHGPIQNVSSEGVLFEDAVEACSLGVPIDMVIMATGYKREVLIPREDRLNGLFLVGFSNDRLLPLKTIGEESERIAVDIARSIS